MLASRSERHIVTKQIDMPERIAFQIALNAISAERGKYFAARVAALTDVKIEWLDIPQERADIVRREVFVTFVREDIGPSPGVRLVLDFQENDEEPQLRWGTLFDVIETETNLPD